MSKEINLLPEKKIIKKRINKALLGSITLFIAVLLLLLPVLIYSYYLNTQVNSLTDKENALLARLQTQSSKQAKLARLSDRLIDVRTALDTRNKLDENIGTVLNFIDSSIMIGSFSFDGVSINVSMATPLLNNIDDILSKIEGSTKINNISSVEMGSLKYDVKNNNYNLDLKFIF